MKKPWELTEQELNDISEKELADMWDAEIDEKTTKEKVIDYRFASHKKLDPVWKVLGMEEKPDPGQAGIDRMNALYDELRRERK